MLFVGSQLTLILIFFLICCWLLSLLFLHSPFLWPKTARRSATTLRQNMIIKSIARLKGKFGLFNNNCLRLKEGCEGEHGGRGQSFLNFDSYYDVLKT